MPTKPNTRTPKPKAGSVVIVLPSSRGPVAFFQRDARDALSLLSRFVTSRCTGGAESVWIYERGGWVPLGYGVGEV